MPCTNVTNVTNDPNQMCSNFTVNPQLCNLLQQDLTSSDNAMYNYCQANPSNLDCACISANNPSSVDYEAYQSLKGSTTDTTKSCWFTPCMSGSSALVPSNLSTFNCPSNICSMVDNNTTYQSLTQCPASSTMFLSGLSSTVAPTSSDTTTIVIIIGILAVILIGILIYYALARCRV